MLYPGVFSLPIIGIDKCEFRYDPHSHTLELPDPRFELPCKAMLIAEAANHFLNKDQDVPQEVVNELVLEVLAWLEYKVD